MTERDGVLGARWGWDAPIDSWGVEALPVTLPPGVRAKDVDTLEITNVDTAKSQRTDGAARIMFYFGEPRLVSIRNKLFSNEGPNRFHYRLVLKAAPSRPLEYDFSLTLLPR